MNQLVEEILSVGVQMAEAEMMQSVSEDKWILKWEDMAGFRKSGETQKSTGSQQSVGTLANCKWRHSYQGGGESKGLGLGR